MPDTAILYGYHAHVYYADGSTRRSAEELRRAISAKFSVALGHVHDRPVGPHPLPMFQISFAVEQFAELVPWLMFNRHGLDILIHPVTDDDVADHRDRAMWLGESQPLNIAVLEGKTTPA